MIYQFKRDLEPIIQSPDQHQAKINEILESASHAQDRLEGFVGVYENPFNEEFRFMVASGAMNGFHGSQLNLLWAAASLMLSIPTLKTEENIQKSIQYLNVCYTHSYVPGLNRLGWCYSEGLGVPQSYHKAIDCFQKIVAKSNFGSSWNSLGWCYEKLGDYKKASECFKKQLELTPENATAKKHFTVLQPTERKRKRDSNPHQFFANAPVNDTTIEPAKRTRRSRSI